eukprot:659075-Amphidinium_carterae.2
MMQMNLRIAMRSRCQSRIKGETKSYRISQTLNYVLAHATKPGSEPHSMIRRITCAKCGDIERTLRWWLSSTIFTTAYNQVECRLQVAGGHQSLWVGKRSHCGPREDRDNHQS